MYRDISYQGSCYHYLMRNIRHSFQITVLDDLSTNECYEDLREFYADYNNITSINKLEGSKFLDNYALLSLRYNKIKSVSKKICIKLLDDRCTHAKCDGMCLSAANIYSKSKRVQ